jgi:hypothetical protein
VNNSKDNRRKKQQKNKSGIKTKKQKRAGLSISIKRGGQPGQQKRKIPTEK